MSVQEQYIGALVGPNFKMTDEGGIARQLINKTGAPSVKGQAVNLSPSYDDSYITATDTLMVVGFVYESGIADGQPVWVVQSGVADVLLQDGFEAMRGGWARLSATTPGRMIVQSSPGYERVPASVTYAAGSTFSGALSDLLLDNGNKMVFAEAAGATGLDATFTFAVEELLSELRISGFYPGNHAAGIQFQVWNYNTAGWGATVITFPASGTDDVVYTATGLTADNFSAGEMKVRMLHSDPGNTNHRVNIDKLVVASSAAGEHFRECGHVLRTVASGTNVLARINIHLL